MTRILRCSPLQGRWAVLGLALVLIGFSARNVAAPLGLCALGKVDCWSTVHTWSCTELVGWSLPLDVDSDGVSDFDFAYRYGGWRCEATPAYYEAVSFQTWAVFPEAHVEVLFLRKSVLTLSPVLEAGFVIRPDPAAVPPSALAGTWSPPEMQPYLRAFGLGALKPSASCHPDDYTPNCRFRAFHGWIPNPGDPWQSNFLFGIRIARTDGWHLGWLNLVDLPVGGTLPGGQFTRVDVGSFTVHPDPDTEIEAGQPPRPRLWHDWEGNQVRLHWRPVWSEYRLERAADLTTAAWEPVSGVTNHSIVLPAGDSPWFFRLTQPPPPTPEPPDPPGTPP